MATVDEIETACEQWLSQRKGKLMLQRTLYMVPGLEDEQAGCWIGGPNTIADVWGPKIFSNWHLAVASRDLANPAAWNAANVRLIDFDANVLRATFLDFATTVREIIARSYPFDGSTMGEYDIMGHSMGGLDAFMALVDDADPANPVAPNARIARAYNFITMDTPYRGIPNVDARIAMSEPSKRSQCEAMRGGSPQLGLVDAAAARLPDRAVRITCYGVDSASQIEVQSGNLYGDQKRFAAAIKASDYRFFQVPGASHSGPQGITQSVISISNAFNTLTHAGRFS